MLTSHKVVNDRQYFFGEWGSPQRSSILGIHGLTANCYHMAAVAEYMAGKGCHALAYDVRGRGDSDPADAPSTMRRHAEDAAAIIAALPAEKVLIFGYSMGAFIGAMTAGLSDKVAGLVMFDGGGMFTRADAEKLIPALARMDKVFPDADAYVEAVKPNYATLGQPWNPYIEAAVRHEVGPRPDGTYKYKGNADRVKEDLLDIAAYPYAEVYAQVRCPVMVVHALGGLGQGAPLYSEASYAIVKQCLPELTFYQTPANHYTMMLTAQPELHAQVEAFAAACGFC